MTTPTDSTVVRRQLGRRLKTARNDARMTIDAVATHLHWHSTKVWRIESGQSPVKPVDAKALCDTYGLDARTTEDYVAMALATKAKGWWHAYGDVLREGLDLYLGLEEAATSLNIYQSDLVPGLLQTADYVRAISPGDDEETVQRKIVVREHRQRMITRGVAPTRLRVLLGETVLRRPVGGSEVMSAQLRRLAELTELPNVEIRVVPFAAGHHTGLQTGTFVVLHFPRNGEGVEVEPPCVYIEEHIGELWLDRPHEVAAYDTAFEEIVAATGDDTGYLSREMLWRAAMEV